VQRIGVTTKAIARHHDVVHLVSRMDRSISFLTSNYACFRFVMSSRGSMVSAM